MGRRSFRSPSRSPHKARRAGIDLKVADSPSRPPPKAGIHAQLAMGAAAEGDAVASPAEGETVAGIVASPGEETEESS